MPKSKNPSSKNTPVTNDSEAAAQSQSQVQAQAQVATQPQEPTSQAPVLQDSTQVATKNRVAPTRDSVEREFQELVASIDEEISKLRETSGKAKGVKFLRTVNKRIKTLRNHSLKISKQRTATKRNNTNSGFSKPVQISKDLAKFTGWDHNQLKSRVDVTKYICNYIKEHDLQDPRDRRNILVDTDPKLKSLLRYDGKDGKQLTYYSLQSYLKPHYVTSSSNTTQSSAPTSTPTPTPASAPASVPATTGTGRDSTSRGRETTSHSSKKKGR